MDTEFELEWQKIERQRLVCFEINSVFRTSVHGFFPHLSPVYNMVRVMEGKTV